MRPESIYTWGLNNLDRVYWVQKKEGVRGVITFLAVLGWLFTGIWSGYLTLRLVKKHRAFFDILDLIMALLIASIGPVGLVGTGFATFYGYADSKGWIKKLYEAI